MNTPQLTPLTNTYGRVLRWQNLDDWQKHLQGIDNVTDLNIANKALYDGTPGSMAQTHPFDYNGHDWYEANQFLFDRMRALGYKWDGMRRRFYKP